MTNYSSRHENFIVAMSCNAHRLRQSIMAYRRDWVSMMISYELGSQLLIF